jgi:hypothetical protein
VDGFRLLGFSLRRALETIATFSCDKGLDLSEEFLILI